MPRPRTTVDDLLTAARARLTRLSPADALAAAASSQADPRLSSDLARTLILVCDEGYQSSLAAATLQDLGFANATDLIGGFQAWRAAGLPVAPPAAA
jgi:rhodanese-related sulfurtransferase